MKIVNLIDSLTWGGAEKTVVTFAEVAKRRNLDLTVISLNETEQHFFAQKLKNLGIPIKVFSGKGLFDYKRIFALAQFLRREKFDVIHAQLTYANIIGVIAGKLAGVPVVCGLQNIQNTHTDFKKNIELWSLKFGARQIIAVGHTVAEAYKKQLSGREFNILQNSVETITSITPDERAAIRSELTGALDRPLLIAVGSLTEQKAHHDLLTAFAQLHQTHPQAMLVIAGKGHLHDELTAQIKALNLEGYAKLLGVRNDIPQLLCASDLFVLASHWEGLPLAVLEAMSAGLPVVATAVADVPRVVVEGTGLLVPPKHPTQLAAAMQHLLDDSEQRQQFGRAAQNHVAHHFNADTWANQLLSIYEKAILSPKQVNGWVSSNPLKNK